MYMRTHDHHDVYQQGAKARKTVIFIVSCGLRPTYQLGTIQNAANAPEVWPQCCHINKFWYIILLCSSHWSVLLCKKVHIKNSFRKMIYNSIRIGIWQSIHESHQELLYINYSQLHLLRDWQPLQISHPFRWADSLTLAFLSEDSGRDLSKAYKLNLKKHHVAGHVETSHLGGQPLQSLDCH